MQNISSTFHTTRQFAKSLFTSSRKDTHREKNATVYLQHHDLQVKIGYSNVYMKRVVYWLLAQIEYDQCVEV